jgi:hypothetical protein
MMKRPRSFISTLIVFLTLATVQLGLTVKAHDAHASALPRVMDPRAGDPTQPGDGYVPPDGGTFYSGDPELIVSPGWRPALWFVIFNSSPYVRLNLGRWPN